MESSVKSYDCLDVFEIYIVFLEVFLIIFNLRSSRTYVSCILRAFLNGDESVANGIKSLLKTFYIRGLCSLHHFFAFSSIPYIKSLMN